MVGTLLQNVKINLNINGTVKFFFDKYPVAYSIIPLSSNSSLVSLSLEGNKLKITDYQSGDNGYVFDWGIMFNSKAFPNIENYQNKLTKSEWQLDSSGAITNNNQDTTYITPKILGKNTYKYIVDLRRLHSVKNESIIVNNLHFKRKTNVRQNF